MKLSTKLIAGFVATASVLGLTAAWRFIVAFANAEELYTCSVKVINAEGQAVDDAQVVVFSEESTAHTLGSKTATTDKSNLFKIENISPGTYTVKVKSDNYETSKRLFRIYQNESLTIALKSSFQQ